VLRLASRADASLACDSIVIAPLPYSSLKFVTPKSMTRHRELGSDQVMSLRAGKTTAVVVALMFPLLLTACSHAAKPVPPSVMLGFCGSTLQVKPDVVLVVCNTNDITARNLTWSGWGEPTATAKGSAVVNLCAFTDCANGNYVSVPIEMAASKIVHCSKNTRAYSTLRYVFPGGSPFRGMPSVEYSPGFGTVPPANQTVSLTC
jgi:hypothetical protein